MSNSKNSMGWTMFLPKGGGGHGMEVMALPFDLEDVAGMAMADLLRRFLGLWSCLVIGTVVAGFSLMASALTAEAA